MSLLTSTRVAEGAAQGYGSFGVIHTLAWVGPGLAGAAMVSMENVVVSFQPVDAEIFTLFSLILLFFFLSLLCCLPT